MERDIAMLEAERQAMIDEEHLRLLSIGYYVSAGVSAFTSLFGLMYVMMGVFVAFVAANAPARPGHAPPPLFVGGIFAAIGLGIFAFMIALAVLKFVVARRLVQRRSRVFCLVIGALCCLGIPYGTVLGVFTLMVLSRRTVAGLFEPQPAAAIAGAP